MQPVLGGLRFRYPVKPHVGGTPADGFDVRLGRCGVFVHVRAEGSRPEVREDERIGTVPSHGFDHGGHGLDGKGFSRPAVIPLNEFRDLPFTRWRRHSTGSALAGNAGVRPSPKGPTVPGIWG